MRKLWSALWFVIVACVALSIALAIIKPWLPLIAVLVIVLTLFVIAGLIWRALIKRRRFF